MAQTVDEKKRAAQREKSRKWYETHREEVCAARRKYRAAHKEEVCASSRRSHEKHRESYCIAKRKYHENHREQGRNASYRWCKEHPEVRKQTVRKWKWKRRLEIIDAYGGACAHCGETTSEFLTIDHIDGTGAEHRRQIGGNAALYGFLKRLGYPKDNYQLLCMNCNFAKAFFGNAPLSPRAVNSWNIRLEVIAAYGGRCACCGESEPKFLSIDHIGGNGAEHKRQMGKTKHFGGVEFYRWLKNQGYPKDNYQLLCMNCNCAKGTSNVCPHQREKAIPVAEIMENTKRYIGGN